MTGSAATAVRESQTKGFEPVIIKAAYAVWKVMRDEAKKHGLARIRQNGFGDGRIMVNTVGAFIKGLNKEREWGLNDQQVDLVRRYMKLTGNVVVLEKVEQYRFRIFVREEWSNQQLLHPKADPDRPPTREEKLTPQEAGEDRPPAPVTYRCAICGETFPTTQALGGHVSHHDKPVKPLQMGRVQEAVLVHLHEQGNVADPRGRVSQAIADGVGIDRKSVTGALNRMDENGLVTRQLNGKRTLRVELTGKGEKLARRLTRTPSRPTTTTPEPPPPVRHPKRQEPKSSPAGEVVDAMSEVSDAIERYVAARLVKVAPPKEVEKLALIRDIIEEVNEGKTAPLKALADIQEAVQL